MFGVHPTDFIRFPCSTLRYTNSRPMVETCWNQRPQTSGNPHIAGLDIGDLNDQPDAKKRSYLRPDRILVSLDHGRLGTVGATPQSLVCPHNWCWCHSPHQRATICIDRAWGIPHRLPRWLKHFQVRVSHHILQSGFHVVCSLLIRPSMVHDVCDEHCGWCPDFPTQSLIRIWSCRILNDGSSDRALKFPDKCWDLFRCVLHGPSSADTIRFPHVIEGLHLPFPCPLYRLKPLLGLWSLDVLHLACKEDTIFDGNGATLLIFPICTRSKTYGSQDRMGNIWNMFLMLSIIRVSEKYSI